MYSLSEFLENQKLQKDAILSVLWQFPELKVIDTHFTHKIDYFIHIELKFNVV